MNKLIDFFARQGLFAGIILFYTIIVGAVTAIYVQKEAFPNVDYDVISITTIFPGSAPEEVEKLITNPIEQELNEVTGIKKMTSVSAEGRSFIVLQIDPDQTNVDDAKQDVQEVIDRITDLPDDAEDPVVVNAESKNQPIIEIFVSGDVSEIELRDAARILEDEIEGLREVSSVQPFGLNDLEIHVEAIPDKLSFYQISLNDLITAIGSQNISIPGGTFESSQTSDGSKKEFIVRTVNELESLDDVRNIVIRANDLGRAVRVKDVAKISYQLEKSSTLFRANHKKSIDLTVLKKEKADAITLVDNVKDLVEKVKPGLGDQIEVSYANDLSYFIRRRLSVLVNNLGIGLFLVLLVLAAFFPMKIALLTAIGIPFSFLGTMIFFDAAGISVNLLTMMGLIIVIGMLVDDAIVVVENAMRYIEKGLSAKEAAIKGTQQIWMPVTAAVATSMAVFMPLMFMTGIFGKFVKYLPMGVLSGLVFSLLECFFILPHHIGFLLKKLPPGFKIGGDGSVSNTDGSRRRKKFYEKTDEFWQKYALTYYEKILTKVLRLRYLVLAGALVLFAGTITLAVKGMEFVLFPPEGVEIFIIRAEAPVGTSLEETQRLIQPIEDEVEKLPAEELDVFITKVGVHQNDTSDPNTKRATNFAQTIVYLTPEPDRNRIAKEIIEDLRRKIGKPEGLTKISFDRVNPGPPGGKPISIGVRAKEYKDILPAVETLKEFLQGVPGTSDLTDSHVLGKEELRVKVNAVDAIASGLTVTDIGTTVRAAFEGVEATQIKKLDEEVAVRVTWPEEVKDNTNAVENIKITNRTGNQIPITSVATFGREQGIASYDHEENERQVRVLGDVDTSVTSSLSVNQLVRENMDEFQKKHPKVEFTFGGEDFDTQESLQSLVKTFGIALLGIFLILVVTFQSMTQALLVLFLTVPLGVIAVIWTFFLHGWPITFMGCLGIIALSGVIVNNSIVFTAFVNEARKEGMNNIDSLIEAGRLRLRPIFLTTVTTVAGILPTAYGIGGLDKFVVPIALALGWGMFFGSVLTTIVFPASMAALDDINELAAKAFNKVTSVFT